MGEKIPYKARKPGGGRKKLKPEYNAGKNLKEQMDAAVILYKDEMTLQAIADALSLNPMLIQLTNEKHISEKNDEKEE